MAILAPENPRRQAKRHEMTNVKLSQKHTDKSKWILHLVDSKMSKEACTTRAGTKASESKCSKVYQYLTTTQLLGS